MNFLFQYTNGVGHLIMSILMALIGLALILAPGTDATTKGVGVSLLLTVSAAWFVPGAARQVAKEVQATVQESVPAAGEPGAEKK